MAPELRYAWHTLVRSGVMEWLAEQPEAAAFDLVVVDPPTYSRSKSTDDDWDIQRRRGLRETTRVQAVREG